VAVVDVGTNSILYLLAEQNAKGEVSLLHQEARSVRLGRKVMENRIIQKEAMEEAIAVLEYYKTLSQNQNADRIAVIGTHVLRTAKNKREVCEILRQKTGWKIEILTEEDEAKSSYRGALYGRPLPGFVSVVDIGGGSTEVILGQANRIVGFVSVNLGAVGLTETFLRHDPPLQNEWSALETCALNALGTAAGSLLKKGDRLVGVAGTVTTLAAMDLRLEAYDGRRVDGHTLSYAKIQILLNTMRGMTLAERQRVLTLDPKRADIILAGAAVLTSVMTLGKYKEITVSDNGLRLGIALREFEFHKN